jgi:lipoprotein-anchoring transpeptidase ErfK/SrfK
MGSHNSSLALQSQSDVASLMHEGQELARQGLREQARRRFFRVLAVQPDRVEALLWLAALAEDPRQSAHYLRRVLAIAPGHPRARAGLEWARKKLPPVPQQPPQRGIWSWLDATLLSAVAVVILVACAIITWMAWQTPSAVEAAYNPPVTPTWTPTFTPTFTPTATATPTPTATPTSFPTATPLPTPTATRVVPGEPSSITPLGPKWIEIQLSTQMLTAYEGETPVLRALVSTGVAWFPTPKGEFTILRKVRSQVMTGPGYYLPNVEFVSYFHKGYAFHGTYWHNNFGHPMSHGCVNMTNADAQWLYNWAPKGTPIRVRD